MSHTLSLNSEFWIRFHGVYFGRCEKHMSTKHNNVQWQRNVGWYKVLRIPVFFSAVTLNILFFYLFEVFHDSFTFGCERREQTRQREVTAVISAKKKTEEKQRHGDKVTHECKKCVRVFKYKLNFDKHFWREWEGFLRGRKLRCSSTSLVSASMSAKHNKWPSLRFCSDYGMVWHRSGYAMAVAMIWEWLWYGSGYDMEVEVQLHRKCYGSG